MTGDWHARRYAAAEALASASRAVVDLFGGGLAATNDYHMRVVLVPRLQAGGAAYADTKDAP